MSQFELEIELRYQGKRLGSLTFVLNNDTCVFNTSQSSIDHTCTATKNVVVYNKERGKCSVPVNGDVLMCHVNTYCPLSNRHQHDLQKTHLPERRHHGSQCLPCSFDPTSSRRCEAAGGVSEAAGDEKKKGGNGVEGTFNKDMTNDEMTFEAHKQIVKP